ncbi:MAG: response regulator [Chitinophagaceae bacterium]|nr:response regulator [Chitinophagaceae bacterium]
MPQNQPLKIFLADRHPHFRENIRKTFRKKNIEISGEADTAEDLLDGLQIYQTDLLITAHRLHDESADYFLPLVKEKYPDIKILLLTLNCDEKVFLKYVNYLDGMLCKLANKEDIVEAVFEIAKKNKLYFRINKSAEEAKGPQQNKLS